jgi:hypothetical protein
MKRFTAFFAICLLAAAIAGCNNYGKEMTFKQGQLFYTEAVTEADAKKVGEYLQNIGYFADDKRRTVQVDKSGDAYALRFVVVEGAEKNEDALRQFKALGRDASQKLFNGAKVDVMLCDDKLNTVKVVSQDS